MSGIYVEKIELHRLRMVVDYVRTKLHGESVPTLNQQAASKESEVPAEQQVS